MKPDPTWTVPLGEIAATGRVDATILITMGNGVQLSMPFHATGMTSLEACQLGMALIDASKEAGARRAKAGR